jgi:hypothetical protein
MTRFDPRRVSQHRSYTIKELSDLIGMSEKTCLRWIEQGLAIVPGSHKPILVLGSEMKKFIRNKSSRAKIKLKRHEFCCFTCKLPRRAKRGSISVLENMKKGLCSVCNGKMSKTIHPIKKDYKIPPPPTQMSMFSDIKSLTQNDNA